MIRKLLAVASLLFLATAARAEWYEATSNNFIVYSQGSEQEARDFAAKLERFRFVLRSVRPIPQGQPVARLRVFLLPDQQAVGRTIGSPSVAGYYIPDARGLMLVGTRHQSSTLNDIRSAQAADAELNPENVLFHEYTHHFTFQYFPATYPIWYSEGFAEFWGTTAILPGDVVEVGAPANHRFSTFRDLGWLPLDRLLRAHNYAELGGSDIFLLYAEGWLLVRYLFDHPARQRQIQEYLRLINNGTRFDQAARQAIPDMPAFNSELFDYAGTARYNVVRLPFRTIDVGPIAGRTLRPAEQALILDEIKLSQGYEQREAVDFANHVRDTASRYPDDPFAIRMIMETAYLAGDNGGATAAADRLLAIEPNNARALATKGLVQCAGLAAAHSTDPAAWRAARQFLVRAVNAAPNDPVVLEAFYNSYVMQSVPPPEAAQNALYTAMELAPSDGELRYELASDFEQRHMIPEAIAIIRPEAYSVPHRGNESEGERRRREAREIRERQAGREHHESALDMLRRLETALAQSRPTEAAH
jgi:tetratricopeptide (TPR) repeat protein